MEYGGMSMDVNPHEDDPSLSFKEREEWRYLREVIARVNAQIQHLESIPRHFVSDRKEALTTDEIAQQSVEGMRDEQIVRLQSALQEPYFGRIDFQEQDESHPRPLYIGKRGLEDGQSGDRLVIDWRAPVASLFYAFTGQTTVISYAAPDGEVIGTVYLKRNILVRNGHLQRVVDSYVHGQEEVNVTDEFLLYRLTENKDARLRDIVSTIQAEQDEIIRSDSAKALVIQGVAGSGKTTVALHRLAYLLYQNSERMSAHKMVIFAPNAMFVDYISEVLPELGVGGIRQTTFADWALELLDHSVVLIDSGPRLARWFGHRGEEQPEDREFSISRYKGSVQFRAQLDRRLQQLEENLVPQLDFVAADQLILPFATIRGWFTEDYAHYPLAKRRERVLARIKRWYEMEFKYMENVDIKGIKKQCAQRFRSYQLKWPKLSAVDLYCEITEAGVPELGSLKPPAAEASTRAKGKRISVHMEDLAAIVYLHFALNGVDSQTRFQHVVIDEAQDFSTLQIEVLKSCCESHSFTILGDLSQSIHSYQGIESWQSFLELFESHKAAYFQLDVSYRSTLEIIEFANHVIERFEGFTLAKPVFRSGEAVTLSRVPAEQRSSAAVNAVLELRAKYNTIAVVCRSEDDCDDYHGALLAQGIASQRIDSGQLQYEGGISVLPVYLTKGLEFDAVLLVDVDSTNYSTDPLSAKLLYVGCTRALHKLWVQYSGAASSLIEGAHGVSTPEPL
jgi:DNA helicase-2/ATP-dependent DNA helicase PcrA